MPDSGPLWEETAGRGGAAVGPLVVFAPACVCPV